MAVVRYLVRDVDESLAFYRALGFKLADQWGPPFAVMKGSMPFRVERNDLISSWPERTDGRADG